MEYNILNEYVKFLMRQYNGFFKIVLGNNYQKKICDTFLEKYITVRYYNETSYSREKDIIDRLNKELVDVFEELVDDDNEDTLKNIVALFGYIVYFDDIYFVEDISELIDTLVDDENIKIEHNDNIKKDLKSWYLNLRKLKDKFNNTIVTKDFDLIERRLYRKIYQLVLQHNVKISNLYSEFAISKAYNSGLINEDKLFITFILGSSLILNSAIILDFSRHYVIDFVSSLFGKEKKMSRLFSIIDNPLAKKLLHVRISYYDYLNNKEKINKLINDGFSFGIIIDEHFDENISELVLFPYIFIREDSEFYDMIVKEKEYIKSKIIKL